MNVTMYIINSITDYNSELIKYCYVNGFYFVIKIIIIIIIIIYSN